MAAEEREIAASAKEGRPMASMSGRTAQIAPSIRNGRSRRRGATTEPPATAIIACDKDEGIVKRPLGSSLFEMVRASAG
jgi:hypothetical protein